ncbi:TPA: biotin/lipoyl-binding protein [Stenotrophomonas maltophilia]
MKHTLAVIGRWSATLVVFALAAVAALSIWNRYETRPWTRDGRVRADVVRVASDMGGLVTQVLVHDNQRVSSGQLLLVLDQPRFAAALEKADAAVSSARATLALARRESTRDTTLGNLVASETRERNAAKVDTELAALAQARAEQRVAQLNVQRTEVRATTDGIITNLDLHAGDYLQPGAQALALIDTGSLRVEGYFEETKLGCITEGDAAVARLMGDDRQIHGHVETIAAGIADDQRSSTHNLLPAVAPTYTWVRLAQRIPVRIRIDDAPPDARLIVGRTASVTITPSVQGACK